MPIIAGQPFYDASGNAITDASNAAIGEPDLGVKVIGGILWDVGTAILGTDIGNAIGDILEQLGVVSEFVSDDDILDALYTMVPAIYGATLSTGHGTAAIKTDTAAILANFPITIPEGPYGLTEAEHNLLVALENVDPDEVADAVWHNTTLVAGLDDSNTNWTYQDLIQNIFASTAAHAGYQGITLPHSPYYAIVTPNPIGLVTANWKYTAYASLNLPAEPDFSQVQEDDNPYTFLARTQPTYGWVGTGPTGIADGQVAWKNLSDFYGAWIRSTFTAYDLAAEYNRQHLTVDIEVNVPPTVTPTTTPTYGTPVALAEAVQIDEAMAGVIIDVTDVGSGVRVYPLGDYSMLYKAGYLAFINPLGYVEEPQFLSFTKGIYVPKTCTEAIGVLVKPNQGQEGTVTPFTLTGA